MVLSASSQTLSVTIQMKTTEQYVLVVLFNIMLFKVVFAFESAYEARRRDSAGKSYLSSFFFPMVRLLIMLYKVVLTFESADEA